MKSNGTIIKMGSGFGVIRSDAGEEILFDVTKCSFEGPAEGDKVVFDIKEGWDGKPRAINVYCPDKGSR